MRSRGEAFTSIWLLVVLVLGGMTLPGAALADTVRLRNGDVITGKLVKVSGGKVVFETEHSGKIEIQADQVVFLQADRVLTIEYRDGRQVNGRV